MSWSRVPFYEKLIHHETTMHSPHSRKRWQTGVFKNPRDGKICLRTCEDPWPKGSFKMERNEIVMIPIVLSFFVLKQLPKLGIFVGYTGNVFNASNNFLSIFVIKTFVDTPRVARSASVVYKWLECPIKSHCSYLNASLIPSIGS
mmetsp:Transcript_4218/g.10177  ORF Transcript_4218/g.10177 Transcript_4218/m.10177 type:complete len:145 (+) Transcript_4218:1699-2133(+)